MLRAPSTIVVWPRSWRPDGGLRLLLRLVVLLLFGEDAAAATPAAAESAPAARPVPAEAELGRTGTRGSRISSVRVPETLTVLLKIPSRGSPPPPFPRKVCLFRTLSSFSKLKFKLVRASGRSEFILLS